jgi:hypothetical protein
MNREVHDKMLKVFELSEEKLGNDFSLYEEDLSGEVYFDIKDSGFLENVSISIEKGADKISINLWWYEEEMDWTEKYIHFLKTLLNSDIADKIVIVFMDYYDEKNTLQEAIDQLETELRDYYDNE